MCLIESQKIISEILTAKDYVDTINALLPTYILGDQLILNNMFLIL